MYWIAYSAHQLIVSFPCSWLFWARHEALEVATQTSKAPSCFALADCLEITYGSHLFDAKRRNMKFGRKKSMIFDRNIKSLSSTDPTVYKVFPIFARILSMFACHGNLACEDFRELGSFRAVQRDLNLS